MSKRARVSTLTLISVPGIVKSRKKRQPYCSINSDVRRVLLYLVKDKTYSIKEAAQKLNINYSTAKTILQLFRRTGRIDKIDKPDSMIPTQVSSN